MIKLCMDFLSPKALELFGSETYASAKSIKPITMIKAECSDVIDG